MGRELGLKDTLQVAGCSGSMGEPGNGSTAFILNGSIALEAGSSLMSLPLDRLLQIDTVILSHAHFDHLCGLPFLVELRKQNSLGPLKVHAHPHAIETLKTHLFNEQIWPDFTQIPSSSQPALHLLPLQAGVNHEIHGFYFVPVEVNHTVPAFGFLIKGQTGSIAYSGDTSPCELFNRELEGLPDLRHVIVECSFPTSHAELAVTTGHMHTGNLSEIRAFLPMNVPLWITSTKAWYADDIAAELACNGSQSILQILGVGQELTF